MWGFCAWAVMGAQWSVFWAVLQPVAWATAWAGLQGTQTQRSMSSPPPPPGTSNWSEDYFSGTAGVGLIVSQKTPSAQPGATTVQEQLRKLFERDWSSHYAMGLDRQVPSQDCVW